MVKREHPHICHLCGGPIPEGVHYNDDMAFTVDHVKSLADGGAEEELGNLRPAHRICNLRKGRKSDYQSTPPKGGRIW